MKHARECAAEEADEEGGDKRKPRIQPRAGQQSEDHAAGDDRSLHSEVRKVKDCIGDVVPHREDRIHEAVL